MTQTKKPNDIILKSTRGLLIFAKWMLVLGVGALAAALPVLLFSYRQLLAEMGEIFVSQPAPETVGLIGILMFLGAVIMLLTLFAINRLRKIVDSVGEGNPFTRINGTRLRGMGIAVFAIQLVTFVGSLLATGLLTMLGEVKPGQDFHLSIDGSISLSGILLVLLLIILARVFDSGAKMQEELDGIV
ncbi:conserved membrane hypothetical protein [Sphingorhabdus sp. 109]|jgi:hypothetical protein|nr:conserved membrane hypothetical protein [Sphingorhabdus sp. 109]